MMDIENRLPKDEYKGGMNLIVLLELYTVLVNVLELTAYICVILAAGKYLRTH